MKRILFLVLCLCGISWGTNYYMRADGTATKINATGPETDATACMPLVTFNGSTFLPGDTVFVSSAGGDYTTGTFTMPSSGTIDNYFCIVSNDSAHIDVSSISTGTRGFYIKNKDYILLQGLSVSGGGGGQGFRFDGTSTGIVVRDCHVLKNYGAADAGDSHDGFSLDGSASGTFYDCTANGCREQSGFTSSHQGLTAHTTAQITWYGGSITDCNYWVASVGTSVTRVYNCTMSGAILKGIGAWSSCSMFVKGCNMTSNDGASGKWVDVESMAYAKIEQCTVSCSIGATGSGSTVAGTLVMINNNIAIDGRLMGTVRANFQQSENTSKIYASHCIFNITNSIGYYSCFSSNALRSPILDLRYNTYVSDSLFFVGVSPKAMSTDIIGNLIVGTNANEAIRFGAGDPGTHNILRNTIIRLNTGVSKKAITLPTTATATYNIVGNIFRNWNTSIVNPLSATTLSHNCYFNSSNAGGTGSITTDPLFTSTANYTIDNTSPCWGTGIDVGITVDALGNDIPNSDNTYSMGWFEYSEQVLGPPTISTISPASGRANSAFSINGSFPTVDSVKINSLKCVIDVATSSKLDVKSPLGSPKGYYTVWVFTPYGIVSETHGYRVKAPSIVVGEVQ